jgi:hypothetical protein
MNEHFWNKKIDLGIKKKELEEKFGMVFSGINEELSTELEYEWLNYIEEFEEQYAAQKTTTVWDYIGKPEYKIVQELSNDEISEELNALLELMQIKGISLNTLSEVDDRELYRFITEELFIYEIDDMHIPGMQNCFTYEDFHPNAQLDIEQAYDYFLTFTLGKSPNVGGTGYDLLYIDTENHLNKNGEKMDSVAIETFLNNFLNTFDFFKIESHKITNIVINSEKNEALLKFNIQYKGCFNQSSETIPFKGEGTFKLKPSEYGGWSIYSIEMPGLSL